MMGLPNIYDSLNVIQLAGIGPVCLLPGQQFWAQYEAVSLAASVVRLPTYLVGL